MAACGPAYLKQQQVEIELISATSQEWIAGARGGGKGVNYKFDIRILTDKKIEFDSVWVNGKQLRITPVKSAAANAAKNSVAVFTASEFTGGPVERLNKKEEAVDDAVPAVASKGALVHYRVNGTNKTLKVDGLVILPPIQGQ